MLALALGAAALADRTLHVRTHKNGSYALLCNNETIGVSADQAFFVNNQWYAAGLALEATGFAEISGDDRLGHYDGAYWNWTAGGTKIETIVKQFQSPGSESFVTFTVRYPDGAEGAGLNPRNEPDNTRAVSTNFPTLFGLEDSVPGVVSWHKSQILPSVGSKTYGAAGGPTIFFGENMAEGEGPVFFATPLNYFKASSEANTTYDKRAAFAPGTIATMSSFPAGFEHHFVFFTAAKGGATHVMGKFRSFFLRVYPEGKTKLADPNLSQLTYQTDNGAVYCYCRANCSTALLDTKQALVQNGVPVRLMSYQSAWWANPNIHKGGYAPWCVSDFGTNHTRYSLDVGPFAEALGLPLQLYAPYFCNDTEYAQSNGGQWDMMKSDTSLPGGCGTGQFMNAKPDTAEAFYKWFLGKYQQEANMTSFEIDFLQQNYECTPEFINNFGAMEQWQAAVSAAGVSLNMPIQFCMATPMDAMNAVHLPAITNFRASADYAYGTSWNLGVGSMLVWAVGSRASKDTFWTSDNTDYIKPNGACPAKGCPADHIGTGCVTNTILAALSTGPVGFSDAVNQTNVALIKRTCTDDGFLLQPTKPLTSLDVMVQVNTTKRPDGHVLGTFTHNSTEDEEEHTSDQWYIFAHQMQQPYTLRWKDLYPTPPLGVRYNIRKWSESPCSNASLCGTVVVPKSLGDTLIDLSPAPSGDVFGPSLYHITPECESGYMILGDLTKFAPKSAARYTSKECTPTGVKCALVGTPGEEVTTTIVGPDDLSVLETVIIGSSGTAVIEYPPTRQ